MVRVANHLIKGSPAQGLHQYLGFYVEYVPACTWPDDTYVQWGNGIVPANPFFEAFPAAGGFIRGDGETIEAAERKAFAKWEREQACGVHFWSRWHPTRGTYTNGAAHCRKCGCFNGSVFPEVVKLGHWRRPLSRMEDDHLRSLETDHEMNAHMDARYPEDRAHRAKSRRILRIRKNLFGVDKSRLGFFD